MTSKVTLSHARTNLDQVCDQVTKDDIEFITRDGKPTVALVSADELSGLRETIHLLSSPNNAKRLLAALRRANTNNSHF
jgi:antitoxin YefM